MIEVKFPRTYCNGGSRMIAVEWIWINYAVCKSA